MRVLRPDTLDEALSLVAQGAARPVAGATAFQVLWAQGIARPDALVDIAPFLPAGINRAGGSITIGAGTTLETLRRAGIPLLSRALEDVAAPGIRRLGTLGGQIGWGAGCLLSVLLVLEAELETTHGLRPLTDFLTRPEGVILNVRLSEPTEDARLVWRKFGLRQAFSPAMLTVAGFRQPGALRLAIGGGLVAPRRLPLSEAAGQSHDTLRRAVEAEVEMPDCPFRSALWRQRSAARALAQGLFPQTARTTRRTLRPLPRRDVPKPGLLSPDGPDWYTRPDMARKARGEMPYLTDIRRPDMLIGRILRAAHPHARILSIDTSVAEALPGVAAVVTHRDIPGLNGFGIVFQDQPGLCADKVRYLGDAVAAVAARDEATAEAALALIRVTYDPLPVVEEMAQALTDGATRVHESGNLVTDIRLERGDIDAGFGEAAHVVEDIYLTPRQMHGFMETEGGHAEVLPDGTLLVSVGGQHGARDRAQLARLLDRDPSTIRVITSPTGGAFGGKDELTVQPALALLALKSGRPVRLQLSRTESVIAGTKRNPMRIRMRTGCDADGKIVAQEVDVLSDSGAYASLSPGVLETGMEHAAGPYLIKALRTRGRLTYSNNGTNGAFRGFGANQMAFAMECQIDRLAAKAGLDPAEIRRRNLRDPGMPGALGQKVAGSERLEEMLEAAAASPLWSGTSDDGEWVTGTGMALIWQGNGLGTIPEDRGEGALRLAPDGKIEVLCGLDEMGQGLHASLRAVVAGALGIGREDVRPVTGDTGRAPDSGSTTASRGGYVVWTIAQQAGPVLSADMLQGAARLLDRPVTELTLVPGGIGEAGRNLPEPILTFADLARRALPSGLPVAHVAFDFPKSDYTKGNARFIFCAGATVARIAASRVSGEIRVDALEMHTAAGPIIDLASYLGQMEGGLVQGLGFTLTEDVLMKGGAPLTRNLDTYAMPTQRDVPRHLSVTALPDLDPGDPYGPRGAGELGIGGVTPAIANAVADAIGHWPAKAPIPPDWVQSRMETR
ncbi:molybdopterin-dependent oxidoreductase [Rhodobacter sp. NTK016B]|uniref:molybdopterin cofactor-binding domain-containing protein n=1 Tax=Rhodobacter sp. NTK016B TaxID=2759676 RepID=UPI001A8BF87C|nr:molybdopterin cofactor-binding domain-containing protein [Rhodobacter sp. NTK016B]MBN8293680.1 molybdopterin-dependent oxidoreductase [Rhodobacter sp. NTK016B]